MNRPIKFRAWDKKFKIMVGASGKLQDLFSIRSDGHINENYILMQFTGLIDKDGKEIWEGDIVKDFPEYRSCHPIYEIIWSNLKAGWLAFAKDDIGHGLSKDGAKSLEVIGNIYENPELLEAQ